MQRIAGKKILFVITKSNWGGAQEYVYTLARRFHEVGADTVVAFGGTGAKGAAVGLLGARLREAGVRTHFINSFTRDMGLVRECKAFFELAAIIRHERPDILHLNSSKAGGLGGVAGRLLGIRRIVYTAHGWPHLESRPLYQRVLIWLGSWATILFSHLVIAVSKGEVRAAPVWFSRRKIKLVYNGISPFPLKARDEARAKIEKYAEGPRSFSFWYLTVSELHPNKGLDLLIRAFDEVARERDDTALVVIGEGTAREELVSLARSLPCSSRVFFTGFVPEARELLSAADTYVLSSHKEGFPFVMLEAGMAQLPVVATRVGAIPEIIEDERSGILVPKGNLPALAGAMARMREEEAFRVRAGLALRARVVRDFSEEAMLLNTISAYS